MRTTISVMIVVAMLIGGALVALRTQLADSWLAFGVHPELLSMLDASLQDQKVLARADPRQAELYRERFDSIQAVLNRLRILEHSRDRIIARYEVILLVVFGGALAAGAAATVVYQRRTDTRLRRLGHALHELSVGNQVVEVVDRGRDAIGRVARMVEETSRVVGTTRRRLAAMSHLESWQEAARRQAHEMRTPLSAARLQLDQARDVAEDLDTGHATPLRARLDNVAAELKRLELFAGAFTTLARLPRPVLEEHDLAVFVRDFCRVYAEAWPHVRLTATGVDRPARVVADLDLLRQVLVNLCENSALAVGEDPGEVRLSLWPESSQTVLEVADTGPGVAPEIRGRLFEPYATTRRAGEGSGLGLAISRKIMLEHGGDLELVPGTPGATFRLLIPRADGGHPGD